MSSPKELYDVVSKYFLIIPVLSFPPYFFVDAPFGRFSPPKSSRLLVDGIKSWIIMEIVSPLCFMTAFLSSPLTRPISLLKQFPFSPPPVLTSISLSTHIVLVPNAPALLVLMFMGHYLNRALLSPLRTPVRSKSHISVPISGVIFNIVNGSLMGAFTAAVAITNGRRNSINTNWKFWAGVGMWAVGFVSNIWHDEVLLNLRRKNRPAGSQKKADPKPRYEVPYGGLYTLISYPNYFSEWFEWLGYAIASSALTAQLPRMHAVFPFAAGLKLGALFTLPYIIQLTPPWLFFFSEVFLMFPRAWNGHKWYLKTFPNYPSERKAVIPFLL